jgi:hypothetical protein
LLSIREARPVTGISGLVAAASPAFDRAKFETQREEGSLKYSTATLSAIAFDAGLAAYGTAVDEAHG